MRSRSTLAMGLGAVLLSGLAGGDAAAQGQSCPRTFQGQRGAGSCYCAPAAMTGAVWGTGTYTEDSSICAAALHAGAVGGGGGVVTVQAFQGCNAYAGSRSNGIASSNYGPWNASFFFPGVTQGSCGGPVGKSAAAPTIPNCPAAFTAMRGRSGVLSCNCPQGAFSGEVWGSAIYTEDSAICRAALHAGVVGPMGGPVTLTAAQGCKSYSGTTNNGVTTKAYGPWNASFYFTAVPPAACR